MTRFEENGSVIEEMTKRAKEKSTGTYEELVTFQLGVIATMLAEPIGNTYKDIEIAETIIESDREVEE